MGADLAVRLPCGQCLELGHDIVDLAARKCKEIWLGLRPETITRQGTQAPHPDLFTFQRAVDVVEPTGPDTMLIFSLGGTEAVARVRPSDHASIGMLFPFEVNMATAKLFDPASGQRLRAAKA